MSRESVFLAFLRFRVVTSYSCIILLFFAFVTQANAVYRSADRELENLYLINRISGFVFDERRNPMSDINVELQDELYRLVNRVRTDATGRFVFAGMTEGVYYIKVTPTQPDYEEQSVRAEIVNIGPQSGNFAKSDDVAVDIYLKKSKDSLESVLESGVVFAQDVPKEAQAAYEKAVSSIKQNNQDEAIKDLQVALNVFPSYFLALNRLGYIYFQKEKYAQASQLFAKAADINNKSEPTLFYLAQSTFMVKDYEMTSTIVSSAMLMGHSTPRLFLLLGKSLRLTKKYEEAEVNLKKADKLYDSKNAETHWELALLYGNNLKRYNVAADHLNAFLKLQPDSKDKDKIRALIDQFKNKEKQQKS